MAVASGQRSMSEVTGTGCMVGNALEIELGISLLGPFPSRDDDQTFVWLRGFPTEGQREPLKAAFYEGVAWTSDLEARVIPLLESYAAVVVNRWLLPQFAWLYAMDWLARSSRSAAPFRSSLMSSRTSSLSSGASTLMPTPKMRTPRS
jgi:hypothetical protein